MTQPFRLASGGAIDRGRVFRFHFDERRLEGHPGDTLASALLANGVRLVARSFKYHRPRGIFSAGAEEPSALVRLEDGGDAEPNRRPTEIALYDGLRAASQHAWPSLQFDAAALAGGVAPLLPAAFYYKTFIRPRGLWMAAWEPLLRRMAGLGRAPALPDPARYDKRHAHCDVLVVGGGPAGLAAALAAGRTGARVILADSDTLFGGALLRRAYRIGDQGGAAWAGSAVAELAALPETLLLPNTTVLGRYDDNYLVAAERVGELLGRLSPGAPAGLPRQRLWHIRARRVVLASGALERPPVFAGNDRPGIMLAGAAETYLHRYAVAPGSRAVLFANNDAAYKVAQALEAAGVAVAAIVDPRPEAGAAARRQAGGIPVHFGSVVAGTTGRAGLRRVRLRRLDAGGGGGRAIECDLLAVSGGWTPTLQLYAQARGRLRFDPRLVAFVPATEDAESGAIECAGAARGSFALASCLGEGAAAGARAAALCGFAAGAPLAFPATAEDDDAEAPTGPLAPALSRRAARRAFVDLHNDVTAADIALAAREGYGAVEHLKRYTTLGMGTDQGKTGNLAGLALLAAAAGREIAAGGTTNFRPPYVPVAYGLLAGRERGPLADPVRLTPMHPWHERAGALFEDVGQWKRPRYYPRPGEAMAEAVTRECLAARDAVVLYDASSLGKIEVRGRDAGRFLDRIYINRWQNLAVGRCRYGVMCRDDGMVFDDGVGARLAAERFLLTTTTGNAGAVMDWLEEWAQTEWPQLEIFCTAVTEEWANATLIGPRAREVLAALAPQLALAPSAFPFMSVREAEVAGIAARICRVSFSGELSYEINVPADYGLPLWELLCEAGAAYGIAACGTEAMHAMRAEKGYFIVGQETDGSVTPLDLGLGAMLAHDKDFLGRRSLRRSDTARPGRKQLVGLLPDNPSEILPEGAPLVAQLGGTPPVPMIGHVTSSYHGARLGRSFALALVEGGRSRHGEPVWAPLPDRIVAARLCPPLFYDIDNRRRDG
ncbi:MAG TPA: sarcosine oxidase subunit alpha family protein [Stellaceae bacterium]|nr:sarcosine oxidase subunit alpha family protein [Stellaceae bacterium]